MHPAECVNCYDLKHGKGSLIPLWDGDRIDLGGRSVRVISISGHTPGSIALLDEAAGILIPGDTVQDGEIFMFGIMRDMYAYIASLRKLEGMDGAFSQIWPSHGSFPVQPSLIPDLIRDAGSIMSGEAAGSDEELFGIPLRRYRMASAQFLCPR